jgi:hypothetical protein
MRGVARLAHQPPQQRLPVEHLLLDLTQPRVGFVRA